MADQKPRQFFRDIKPGDVSIEGRQSNGITADNSGNVFIYSGLKEAELENLTEQQYRGNVPIYYGNSYIAVAKSQTHETLQLGNNNYETVDAQTDPNKITTATTNTVNCADEFDDASNILLNWENDNQKFGWGPYGLSNQKLTAADTDKNGKVDFQEAQKYFLDNYWKNNNNNKDLTNYGISNANDPKLLIDYLPPGLRIVASQLNYSTGAWWTRILVALGPDFANAKDSNGKQLGIPYKESTNIYNSSFDYVRDKNTGVKTSEKIYNPTKNPPVGSETILWHTDRIQLFVDQYDEIIKYYDANKATFLENLYQESLRFYRGITAVKQNNETNPTSESLYKDFYVQYATKARDLALKYKDCPLPPKTKKRIRPQNNTSSLVAQLPVEETKTPTPAPLAEGEFEFLDETQFALEPVQLTKIIDVEEYRYNVITRQKEPTGRIISVKVDTVTKSNTTGFDKNNIKTTFDFFISKGFTKAQSAGIVGALLGESGLNPLSVNSIGATGIAQWLGVRKDNLFKLSNYKSLQTQLDFLWSELQVSENLAYRLIKKTTTAAEAAIIYESKFERPSEGPGSPFFNRIQAYANDIFSKY